VTPFVTVVAPIFEHLSPFLTAKALDEKDKMEIKRPANIATLSRFTSWIPFMRILIFLDLDK
jgi:hypothetical protein